MSSELIQAEYNQLQQIVQRFQAQSETNRQLIQNVRQYTDALRSSGWRGLGSEAFFNEMDHTILPALARLTDAFDASSQVTAKIAQVMKQAEADAAAPFRKHSQGNAIPLDNKSMPALNLSQDTAGASGQLRSIPETKSSIWDYLRIKGNLWESIGASKKGKFDPNIKATVGIEDSSVWHTKSKGLQAVGGYVEAGAKLSMREGVMLGAGGEYYTLKATGDTALVGDREYGVTVGGEFKAASAEGFAGVRYDSHGKEIGAKVGLNLASVQGSVGGNVAGVNVSVLGEAGVKAEFGFELTSKKVKVSLPIFSVGLKWGEGID